MTQSQVTGGAAPCSHYSDATTKVAVTGFERNLARRHPCQLRLTMENDARAASPEEMDWNDFV